MQSNDSTASDSFYKLWAWFEDNLKTIVIATGIFAVVMFVYSYYSYSVKQKEITAGQELTKTLMSGSKPSADAFMKLAAEYPGTASGQRALMESAATLFDEGKFAEAQAQAQKYLDTYPDGNFTPQAMLGVAAGLEAQGKTDLALSAYERAAGQIVNNGVAVNAKFAIARMYDAQGKIAEAVKLYEEVARAYPNSSLSNEAGLRAMELKTKLPAPAATTIAKPLATPAPAAPIIPSK